MINMKWKVLLFALLFPTLVSAQSFPSTSILDNFNRANETPISTGWTGGITAAGECDLIGNLLTNSGSGDETCYYSASTFGADQEVFVTFPNATTHPDDVNVRVYMCLQDNIGTSTVDGYGFRYRKITGASNDAIQMFRLNAASTANIGIAHVEEFSDGDQVGMRIETGGTLTLYYRSGGSGAWTQVDQVTGETTFTCAGTNLGIGLVNPGHDADDFGGGDVVSASPDNPVMMILEAK